MMPGLSKISWPDEPWYSMQHSRSVTNAKPQKGCRQLICDLGNTECCLLTNGDPRSHTCQTAGSSAHQDSIGQRRSRLLLTGSCIGTGNFSSVQHKMIAQKLTETVMYPNSLANSLMGIFFSFQALVFFSSHECLEDIVVRNNSGIAPFCRTGFAKGLPLHLLLDLFVTDLSYLLRPLGDLLWSLCCVRSLICISRRLSECCTCIKLLLCFSQPVLKAEYHADEDLPV